MPFSYDIDEGLGFLVAKATGALTGADYSSLLGELGADVRFNDSMSQLFDLRQVETIEFDARMVPESMADCAPSNARVAVVSQEGGVLGWSERLEDLLGGDSLQLRAFQNLDSAERWLVGGS